MKAKTIKSVLRRKILHWAEHIKDEDVRNLVLDNTIVTGGALVSMLLNEKVSDFDIYLRSPQSVFAVAQYYLEQFRQNPPTRFKSDGACVPMHLSAGPNINVKLDSFEKWDHKQYPRLRIVVKSAGVASEDGADNYSYFETSPDPSDAGEFVESAVDVAESADEGNTEKGLYRPVFITSNAITLSDKVQIVIRFWGEADTIHENYDFVHCKNFWQSWDGRLVLHNESLECILNKELRYSGSKYPVCSLFRIRKFLERGWRINAGQILKIALQVAELDLMDAVTLEDQLIGVDAAYFQEVISLCQKRMEETKSDRVDYAYLVEVIDRIF